MIVAARMGERYFLLYGFKKNDRSNIGVSELREFKSVAVSMVGMSDLDVKAMLEIGELEKVSHGSTSR